MEDGDSAVGGDVLRAMSAAAEKMATVDRRIVETIIRAVYRWDSFILKYDWIEDELRAVVSSEDEYKALEEKMYEYISDGKIKNVKVIFRHFDSIGDSVVAVAPCTLSKEQWEELEDLADLYDYAGYEDPSAYRHDFVVKPDRPSLDFVLHNLIRAQCAMTYADANAYAVYSVFNETYKLEKKFKDIIEDAEP
jgi:hypothetical protein